MRRTLCILLALMTLAAPLAAANWSYRGSNEPDTAFDTPTYMFLDPDTNPDQGVNKVYFNGFGRVSRFTHYSPNVAATGSTVQPLVTTISAVLGFWKDCNNDGYIGLVESAAIEYRAELLLDDTICPARAPTSGQSIYPHNDGTWIRELIWIGPSNQADGAIGAYTDNPTNFYAPTTAIWGDWGLPGTPPVLTCSGAGNAGLRSTGAIIDVVDCQTYFKGIRTLNDVQDLTGAPVGGWEYQDVDNSPSLLNVQNPAYPYLYGPAEPDGDPFEGDYRGYSGGIFGRDSGEGEGEQRERLVTIVDCDTDGPNASPTVNQPSDIMDPATYPSLYESLNDTYEVATQNPSAANGNNPCNPDGDADQGLPYNTVHPEAYAEHTYAEAGRDLVDHVFKFSVGSRNTLPAGDGACRTNPSTGQTTYTQGELGYCVPADLGLAVERDDGPVGPAWRTNPQIVTATIVTRDGLLKNDNPDPSGWYMSFYAKMGPAVTAVAGAGALPSGASNIYGVEACGENDSGIHNYWHCDPAAWVQRCADAETPTLPQHCYRVGFTYNLRDIDCWDGTLARGTGIHASLVDLSATGPCELNPDNSGMDLPVG